MKKENINIWGVEISRKRMNTGDKIRSAREYKGWSKAELHRRTGVAYSSIVDIERGKRKGNFETICLIADALEVTTDSLKSDR